MGVTGLWKLIEASGKPVPLETLENKVLAIDISIWLHQVVKGYQDNKGGYLPNAHLLGLFNRICKLLYFRIKPVFVFDGGVPELKRQTIAKRSQSKTKIQNEAERLEKLLLESLAKEKIVKQALGDPERLSLSPPKKLKSVKAPEPDDIFKLPPLKKENEDINLKTESDEDEDEEFCPKRSYDVNINKIDVTSTQFKSLPADIRHDILTDIKETRKQNSWARLRELPVESNDFSSYQMSRLLRRRQVQVSMEEAEKEMGGKTWSLTELETLLSEDGILETSSKHCQKIASDENTRFLLVRDIAKAMNEIVLQTDQPGPSTLNASSKQHEELLENLDDEDFDLQRAIQMSLGNDPVEIDSHNSESSDGRVKLNAKQREKFSGTIQAHGLIRGFMMEYAEMNDTDIKDLMDATQAATSDEATDPFRANFPNTDDYVLYGTPKKNRKQSKDEETLKKNLNLSESEINYTISDDDSDNDLIEVRNEPTKITEKVVITVEPSLKDFKQEDDLFADVFKTSFTGSSEIQKESAPDVEVASISSDDDTLPYDVHPNDIDDINQEAECSFVSEENKLTSEYVSDETSRSVEILEAKSEALEEVLITSENDKFWNESDEPIAKAGECIPPPTQELSENDKFWGDEEINEARDNAEIPNRETTPIKLNRTNSPPPAKVASPFFVNRKTPSAKKGENEAVGTEASSVAKLLFRETDEENLLTLQQVAQELRIEKTSEELQQMREQLVDEQRNLALERNRMDRMGMSITESMSRDCKDLLKLFGIPYIDSPMEAEAQCAFLNMIELTDGTISDDSDIWLFGGQTVYKNFFVQKKIVMEFSRENIEQMFHLDRKKLIQLAMLVGSDYTIGLNGVGAVTALEILAAFPVTPESDAGTDQYQSVVSSLRKFREWFQNGKESGPGGKSVLKSKLKNVELLEGFPNLNVARAYLDPIVDTNAEKFSWGMPDTESLVEFAKSKLGWTRLKTDEILSPVMKRLNEKKQATIKDYFKSQISKKFFDNNKMSKRVQKAVGKMGGEHDDEVEKEEPKKTRKRKTAAKSEKKAPVVEENPVLILSDEEDEAKVSSPKRLDSLLVENVAATSSKKTNETPIIKPQKPKAASLKRKPKVSEPSTSSESVPVKKRAPRIPNPKQTIPQREKDKEDMEKSKQKAIEIFKKSTPAKKNNVKENSKK